VLKDRADETLTVMVEDKSGTATCVTPLPGDRIARWICRMYEGSHSGRFWQIVVFLCGLVPLLFAVSGTLIWRRSVRLRRRRRGRVMPQLEAVESWRDPSGVIMLHCYATGWSQRGARSASNKGCRKCGNS
jgi:uncharacterized iron-regulated membrane protein